MCIPLSLKYYSYSEYDHVRDMIPHKNNIDINMPIFLKKLEIYN